VGAAGNSVASRVWKGVNSSVPEWPADVYIRRPFFWGRLRAVGAFTMSKMIQSILEVLERDEDLVMATVVDGAVSSRLAGARMLILSDGRISGSIGGGEREAEVQRLAAGILKNRGPLISIFSENGTDALSSASICGGITVAVEYIAAVPENRSLFHGLMEAQVNGKKSCLLTPVSGNGGKKGLGERMLFPFGGSSRNETGAPILLKCVKDMEKLGEIRLPVIRDFGAGGVFINPWRVPEAVYIFGAGHIGQETAELAGKSGFRTVVLDDRAKYANRDRFPCADDVVALESFDNCFEGLALTSDSFIIIATRGHRYEKTLVKQALRTRAGYIGLIGSLRKRDTLFTELSAEGFSIDDLLRVYCPTGISILAETPAEIAVSIVAQLVLLRARRAAAGRMEMMAASVDSFLLNKRECGADGFIAAGRSA